MGMSHTYPGETDFPRGFLLPPFGVQCPWGKGGISQLHPRPSYPLIPEEVTVDLWSGLFSAFGLSASAGLNAYIPLLIIALTARYTDLIHLNPPWDALTNGWVIALLVVLAAVEFLADKIPAVNHLNDLIQSIVRPTAGALAFAASARVITDVHPALSLALGLLVAGSVHAVKAGVVRPAVSVTTGGAGNTPVSLLEDAISTVVSILAVVVPLLIGLVLLLFAGWLLARWLRRAARG